MGRRCYAGFGEEIAEAVTTDCRNIAIVHVNRIVTEQDETRQLQNSGIGSRCRTGLIG